MEKGIALLTVKEVAARLGISKSFVYMMAGRREIPIVKIGSSIRVPEKHLDEWIAKRIEIPLEERKRLR